MGPTTREKLAAVVGVRRLLFSAALLVSVQLFLTVAASASTTAQYELSSSSLVNLTGNVRHDQAGPVAALNDVDGDSITDIAIGVPGDDTAGVDAGAVYVLYGGAISSGGLSSTLDDYVATASSEGFVVHGAASGDGTGSAVAAAGDVNNDGVSDFIIGAEDAKDSSSAVTGEAYVIYGTEGQRSKDIDLADGDLESSGSGFTIVGDNTYTDKAGKTVAAAGDINGDGYDDVMVGDPLADQAGSDCGAVYVIYGAAERTEPLELLTFKSGSTSYDSDHPNGFTVSGSTSLEKLGSSLASFRYSVDDNYYLYIGAPGANYGGALYSGEIFVIDSSFYKKNDNLVLDDSTYASYINEIGGENAGDRVGTALAVNSSGTLIGAPNADNAGSNSGSVYVLPSAEEPSDIDLSDVSSGVSADSGYRIDGSQTDANFGSNVAFADDYNGDNLADFIVGASGLDYQSDDVTSRTDSGAIYVMLGQNDSVTQETSELANDGYILYGDSGDAVGSNLGFVQDLGGSGTSAILSGASSADRAGSRTMISKADVGVVNVFTETPFAELSNGEAADITDHSATLTGTVTAGSENLTYSFAYGAFTDNVDSSSTESTESSSSSSGFSHTPMMGSGGILSTRSTSASVATGKRGGLDAGDLLVNSCPDVSAMSMSDQTSISVSDEPASVSASISGLNPETYYCAVLKATTESGYVSYVPLGSAMIFSTIASTVNDSSGGSDSANDGAQNVTDAVVDALTIKLGGAKKQKFGKKRVLKVRVSCNVSCPALTAKVALKGSKKIGKIKLAKVAKAATSSKQVTLKWRLTKKTSQKLRRILRKKTVYRSANGNRKSAKISYYAKIKVRGEDASSGKKVTATYKVKIVG